ncbi:MAG: UDP-N-acetylmuramoyl-L-alanyl-D-glutamate--2,6-diaminopimelate ligase [Parcubacteria group bacterium]|nr:UDP-N-acetylmuramoyl-L-alanyl-D-glutamate--2,6-diaminopimelate ligase [Parcubacteria group bacterium]
MLNLARRLAPKFLIDWYHFCLALVAALIYGFPSRKLVVIGVTGTNGKSTTVEMISRILEQEGKKTASLSSVRFRVAGKDQRNTLKMTMPGRFFLQRFLCQAVKQGCTHAVLEITSEGILQHRHRFINFHTAVFTNLSPEHIERHGSFEKYREAKGRLFQAAKEVHVINLDDEHAEYFLQFSAQTIFGYRIPGLRSRTSIARLDSARQAGEEVLRIVEATLSADERGLPERQASGVRFSVGDTEFHLNLLGTFNVSNALAAICTALSQGVNMQTCKKALESIEKVPGRMEQVATEPVEVIVDYAFTPDALEKVYKTLRQRLQAKTSNGKLICVLGAAGGGRDAWKRPILGKLAGTYCDVVIVTNEDPYDEDPQKIIDEVIAGAEYISQQYPHKSAVLKIPDRREAIAAALQRAEVGDTIVITGKGSEDSIAWAKGKKTPWDDREVVKEELDKTGHIG